MVFRDLPDAPGTGTRADTMAPVLDRRRRYHFLGIGGVGMSALAEVLHTRGYRISGSDSADGPVLRHLAASGIPVSVGHAPALLEGVDAVVFTPAVPADHPVWAAVNERKLPRLHRAQLLGALTGTLRTVAVAGTHGKTTTSAALAWALTEAGWDPTALIGGHVPQFGGRNNRTGKGDWLVAEADESDASFLHLAPQAVLLTNVEPEHLDHHGSPARVRQAFADFLARLPRDGLLAYCADDPAATDLARDFPGHTLAYGTGPGAAVRVRVGRMRPGAMELTLHHAGREQTLVARMAGRHNALNLAGVYAMAQGLNLPEDALLRALAGFKGVARRQQYLGEVAGRRIFDDYAHHPTEIRATLDMFLELYGEPITVVFQPHLYSRTAHFAADFAQALQPATRVYVTEIYGSREAPQAGVSAGLIMDGLAGHPAATLLPSWHDFPACIARGEVPPGVVLTLGAGDITGLGPLLLDNEDL